jgi:hypothetical protein
MRASRTREAPVIVLLRPAVDALSGRHPLDRGVRTRKARSRQRRSGDVQFHAFQDTRGVTVLSPTVDLSKDFTDQHTVRFALPGVELDLGGIAKGFAVELAADVLRRHGLAGSIDTGGNAYFVGVPPGKHSWTVGVKNPDASDRLLGVVECSEQSVSTSADYANFLTAGGRTYGHILDPRTLQPSDAALSVTILSRDKTLADAMSKAAFMLGPTAGLALIESTPGMSGLIAFRKTDGSLGIAVSSALKSAFHPAARETGAGAVLLIGH